MSRKALRWIIFGALLVLVAGIAVTNTISNARFEARLARADVTAFSEFADRADAYNLFISMEVPARLRLVQALGNWESAKAPGALLGLSRDPNRTVREALRVALTQQAQKPGADFTTVMEVTDAPSRAILIEALVEARESGRRIAESAFLSPGSRMNASAALIRFGETSLAFLTSMLGHSDHSIALDAADTLARIGSRGSDPAIGQALWRLFLQTPERLQQDKLIPILAAFGSVEAANIFEETVSDQTAPPRLRAAAAAGLYRIGRLEVLKEFLDDPDPGVRAAAAGH
ncbi:MAG: hypothetical protein KIT74_12400 [Fimbriimonadales bacterium]|nr:hypothetical protein [Fimbriimonadales bacterium]